MLYQYCQPSQNTNTTKQVKKTQRHQKEAVPPPNLKLRSATCGKMRSKGLSNVMAEGIVRCRPSHNFESFF